MTAPAAELHEAGPRRRLNIHVPDDLYQRISAAAKRRNITKTALVKVILSATFPADEDPR